MTLNQLRYLAAIVQNDLNISTAARKLHTSQPGVSNQFKVLEDELGFPIFEREARNLTAVTAASRSVVAHALRILEEACNIRRISQDLSGPDTGMLSIGTTATQARYVLPQLIRAFRDQYPGVELHVHLGSSEQIAELAGKDQVDLAIASSSDEIFRGYVLLPCFRWQRRIVVPADHPLLGLRHVRLEDSARFPIVTYTFSFRGASSLPSIFEAAGLSLKVALTATDADVIKTYVRLGLGVGIIASMAVEADNDLASVDVDHLFPEHTTWIGFRQGRVLRKYTRDFMKTLARHLDRRLVDESIRASNREEVRKLSAATVLPTLSRLAAGHAPLQGGARHLHAGSSAD